MSDLADRILEKLARASSKRPTKAEDLLALVGGAEADFWPVIEQLIADKALNTAHIQRAGDPAPWLALWPTGIHKPAGGWTNNAHSCLFTPSEPARDTAHKTDSLRVRAEPAPVPKPAPPATVRPFAKLPADPLKSPVQRAILDAARGRPQSRALLVPELAVSIGFKPESIQSSLLRLERDEFIGICHVAATNARGQLRRVRAVYDPAAPAEPEPAAPATINTEATMPTTPATPRASRGSLQARICEALTGITREHAITCAELSQRTGASKETIDSSLRRLIANDRIGATVVKSPRGKPVRGLYGLDAAAELESPELNYNPDDVAFPPAFVPAFVPEPEHVCPSAKTRFALLDDGTLVVQASTGPLVIDSDAVERLARLLGVPRNTAEAAGAAA